MRRVQSEEPWCGGRRSCRRRCRWRRNLPNRKICSEKQNELLPAIQCFIDGGTIFDSRRSLVVILQGFESQIMDNAEYLRRVAQRCFELSTQCFHLEIARKLRDLGTELDRKASKQDLHRLDFSTINISDPPPGPDTNSGRPSSNARKSLLRRAKTFREAVRRHPIVGRIVELVVRAISPVNNHYHRRSVSSQRKISTRHGGG